MYHPKLSLQNQGDLREQANYSLIQTSKIHTLAKRVFIFGVGAVCLYYGFLSVASSHFKSLQEAEINSSSKPFSWDSITPSTSLVFTSCFDAYQCAYLSVPLDWNSSQHVAAGPFATIAVIKRPALVDVTDPRYAGPILFNPGGPGNSGIKLLRQYGKDFETIFNPRAPIFTNETIEDWDGDEKYFDLISFDPRGVENSSPKPNCITSSLTRQIWNYGSGLIGTSIEEENTFGVVWAALKAYGSICSHTEDEDTKFEGHAAQYVSSAQVASDMLAIIEKHGKWRAQAAERLLQTSLSGLTGQEKAGILARTAHLPNNEKLQYWGFSYGSVLGQTFASMFPERVGRMVLDGNVDAEDYATISWAKNLNDIDSITENFSSTCFKAGNEKCSLYNSTGPDSISNAVNGLLEELRYNPRYTVTTDGSPLLITQSLALDYIFGNWYNAYYGFPLVDKFLSMLIKEDYTLFNTQPLNATCSSQHNNNAIDPEAANFAIRCTDGPLITNMPREAARAHITHLRSQSHFFGEAWSTARLACIGYTVRPVYQFLGPFGASRKALNHPILFANPELDPVTPLRNAVKAARDYPGSKVLEVSGGIGHCTTSMPSLDGWRVIRRYFATGKLPEKEVTKVGTSVKLWDEKLERPEGVGLEIWKAVGRFARGFPRSLHGWAPSEEDTEKVSFGNLEKGFRVARTPMI
ncbi:hypothetical protein B0O99DRAFT_281490 [Bisporella sp. PMI_857]|nr:hypothetical protein B0O99DRAFT_281490 [Bisporella sp. PMI_857]